MPKIYWESAPNVSVEQRDAYQIENEKLRLPKHRGAGRLAVVGSGPSIREHVEELRAWDGAVWAVNGTINWCLEHGIDAWFYTADASDPYIWPHDLTKVRKAVLTSDISPAMISYLSGIGANVELVGPPQSGPTSANASDYLSIQCGYRHITYFGCEGCFDKAEIGAISHASGKYQIEDWIIIKLAGEYYKTKNEFISQSIMLANTIEAFPHVYAEKSGGLLAAMIKHGIEYEDVMVSNTLFAKLKDAA